MVQAIPSGTTVQTLELKDAQELIKAGAGDPDANLFSSDVSLLRGIGPARESLLEEAGVTSIGDFYSLPSLDAALPGIKPANLGALRSLKQALHAALNSSRGALAGAQGAEQAVPLLPKRDRTQALIAKPEPVEALIPRISPAEYIKPRDTTQFVDDAKAQIRTRLTPFLREGYTLEMKARPLNVSDRLVTGKSIVIEAVEVPKTPPTLFGRLVDFATRRTRELLVQEIDGRIQITPLRERSAWSVAGRVVLAASDLWSDLRASREVRDAFQRGGVMAAVSYASGEALAAFPSLSTMVSPLASVAPALVVGGAGLWAYFGVRRRHRARDIAFEKTVDWVREHLARGLEPSISDAFDRHREILEQLKMTVGGEERDFGDTRPWSFSTFVEKLGRVRFPFRSRVPARGMSRRRLTSSREGS